MGWPGAEPAGFRCGHGAEDGQQRWGSAVVTGLKLLSLSDSVQFRGDGAALVQGSLRLTVRIKS